MANYLFENKDLFPAMGLGTYLSTPAEVYASVMEALRIGYRHIDCASIYGNEAPIGAAIKDAIAAGLVRRSDLFVCSKLWNNDHAPKDAAAAFYRSLSALQLDYLDVYLMHWPVAFKPGSIHAKSSDDLLSLEAIPLACTWNAMADLKIKGEVCHIGVSNFNSKKIAKLFEDTGFIPELNQIEVHPFFQQTELVNWCQERGILLTAFSPLGSRG